jgi:hypothetical protein
MFDLSIAPKALRVLVEEYLAAHPTVGRAVGWTDGVEVPDTHVWFSDGSRVTTVVFAWNTIALRGGTL